MPSRSRTESTNSSYEATLASRKTSLSSGEEPEDNRIAREFHEFSNLNNSKVFHGDFKDRQYNKHDNSAAPQQVTHRSPKYICQNCGAKFAVGHSLIVHTKSNVCKSVKSQPDYVLRSSPPTAMNPIVENETDGRTVEPRGTIDGRGEVGLGARQQRRTAEDQSEIKRLEGGRAQDVPGGQDLRHLVQLELDKGKAIYFDRTTGELLRMNSREEDGGRPGPDRDDLMYPKQTEPAAVENTSSLGFPRGDVQFQSKSSASYRALSVQRALIIVADTPFILVDAMKMQSYNLFRRLKGRYEPEIHPTLPCPKPHCTATFRQVRSHSWDRHMESQHGWTLSPPPSRMSQLASKAAKMCWTNENQDRNIRQSWSKFCVNFRVLFHEEQTKFNSWKLYVEYVTGELWDWWPLKPSFRALLPDEVRVQWQCVSDDEVVSLNYLRSCSAEIRTQVLVSTARKHVLSDVP